MPDGPYEDSFTSENLLAYRYRGTDPGHRDNAGLRRAMQTRTPLVYFHGVVKGWYLAVWPVFIVGDNPGALTFTVAADDARLADASALHADAPVLDVREEAPAARFLQTEISPATSETALSPRDLG